MAFQDNADLADHRTALARLDEAGLRLEEARVRNTQNRLAAEQALAEAMNAYEAVRERFTEPPPRVLDGAPVARVWLGQRDVLLRAPADLE